MSTEMLLSQYRALRRDTLLHCDCDVKLTLPGKQSSSKPRFHFAYACNHKIALTDIALALLLILLAAAISCCRFHLRFKKRR